jgi:hypothetical protein
LNTGKYDEKAFYSNHRFKKDSQPMIYSSCTLETIGGTKKKHFPDQTPPKHNDRSVAPFAYDPVLKTVREIAG